MLRDVGFTTISCASDLTSGIGFVDRTMTACIDAYLSPIMSAYFNGVAAALPDGSHLHVMASSGTLVPVARIRARDCLLSGPAGGVVGAARAALDAGFDKAIGVDMGGTSTDVCRIENGLVPLSRKQTVGDATLLSPSAELVTVAAGGGSITIATNGAQVRYVPDNVDANGNNVDNRYQTVTVSSTTNVVAGDCFTIAGIEAVHMITKESTGQLKTFRVISVDSGTTMTISPPMIGANSSPTAAETAYKNINVASTSGTAAINWLNDNAAGANPFWFKDSIELLPGRYAVPDGQGVDIMRGTTDQGLEVVMGKKFDNSTFTSLYTLDVLYGVVNTNPQMNGVILFGQP
jgi:N-methylhydantoinase A/oxoprolinase/acetone carboxylase beta subunit